ncbi:DUF58 domain-containing protein [Luteibacter pinisoli]|uniref:DUF58 domain-containing protein n=1 Tax=Luteibacter pinisoli TaxID=2589080 RepID=A0A4Y5ZB69_9GAMM|nr:DUF58 domain-containing protein [Luteibacter pinisoli]QDE41515.1 DUF58 domain-containing protein [Luteibacter pinisoli]
MPVVADPRVQVALPELIALRSGVMRARAPEVVSHAPRSGQRPGRLHGRGMDYAESRVYQAGDDVRRMDWRLTARSGVAHTKLFQEEREGRLLILLDTNASMRFGTRTRFKSVQAARVAATAAWYAIRGGDRVGVLAFGAQHHLLRMKAGPRGALAVCGALAAWDAMPPGEDESLSAALQRAGRLMHGASRVLLVSDGFAVDDAAYGRMLSLVAKAEVRIVTVADPLELAEPPAGRYPFAHKGVHYDIALHGERQRAEFARALGDGHQRLASLASRLGLRQRIVDTTAEPLDAIVDLLGSSRGR